MVRNQAPISGATGEGFGSFKTEMSASALNMLMRQVRDLMSFGGFEGREFFVGHPKFSGQIDRRTMRELPNRRGRCWRIYASPDQRPRAIELGDGLSEIVDALGAEAAGHWNAPVDDFHDPDSGLLNLVLGAPEVFGGEVHGGDYIQ